MIARPAPGSSPFRPNHAPVWASVSPPPGSNQKPVTYPSNHVYYDTLKPIFIVLTLAGVLPIFRIKAGSGSMTIQISPDLVKNETKRENTSATSECTPYEPDVPINLPIFLLFVIFGKGNHKLQAAIVGGVCLSVYLVFAYLTYLVTYDIVQLVFHDDNFNSVIVQATLMLLLIQHVFYMLLTWPESLSVNNHLVQWKHFQNKYELLTRKKLVLMSKTRTVIAVLVAMVISIVYPFVVNMIDEKSVASNTVHLTLTYHIFVQLCFYVLWFANSWAITQTAQQFNTVFIQECEEMSAERLQEFRLLWLRLVQLVRAGSSMLCYSMAMALTTPFVYQVIGAYNVTMFVIRSVQEDIHQTGSAREAVAVAITFVFYALLSYKFCDAGHCITAKCEKIQDTLLTYKPKIPSAAINSEVRLFLRCMRSVPPQATLSGYVIINRKVYLHMTGVLVTYLIILVQFNIGAVHNTNQISVDNNIQSSKYIPVQQ